MSEELQIKGNNTFEWKIVGLGMKKYHEIAFQIDGRHYLMSGEFLTSDYRCKNKWRFRLSTKDSSIFPLHYTFSVVDHERQEFLVRKGTAKDPYHMQFLSFLQNDFWEEKHVIQNDTLILRFTLKPNWDIWETPQPYTGTTDCVPKEEVSLSRPTKDSSTNTDGESNNFLETLSEDFLRFYEYKKDTDCILKIGEIQFPVHRTVLSARCPAFSAMFHHDTAENRSGEVDIPDVDATSFGKVLYYIYSGKVRGLRPETAASIYTVADKYALIELRTECLEFLKSNLTVENIGDAALLAHTHGETELEEKVIQFIEVRIEDVIECSQWKEFSTIKPLLANKLLGTALVACRKKLKFER